MKRRFISRAALAGGAPNPRTVSGSTPDRTGNRFAGDPFQSRFITEHAPMVWAANVAEFGGVIEYWPGNDSSAAVEIDVIWTEGVEGEQISPGRYSHAAIRDADLPDGPRKGDAVIRNGVIYDVVSVEARTIGYSTLVLQDRTEAF